LTISATMSTATVSPAAMSSAAATAHASPPGAVLCRADDLAADADATGDAAGEGGTAVAAEEGDAAACSAAPASMLPLPFPPRDDGFDFVLIPLESMRSSLQSDRCGCAAAASETESGFAVSKTPSDCAQR